MFSTRSPLTSLIPIFAGSAPDFSKPQQNVWATPEIQVSFCAIQTIAARRVLPSGRR
jgi:hypothetical protein